jgi:hypothetical protein
MCGVLIFMRSAGMRHSAASRLNSSHVTSISSEVRTNVNAMSLRALRV